MRIWPAAHGTTIHCSAWGGFEGDHLQPEVTTAPWLHYPPGTLLNEILYRVAMAACGRQNRAQTARLSEAVAHGPGENTQAGEVCTCCSQVMALFLDIHTPK